MPLKAPSGANLDLLYLCAAGDFVGGEGTYILWLAGLYMDEERHTRMGIAEGIFGQREYCR